MDLIVMVLKLVMAVLLGGLIGIEREQKHQAAGLRTHLLVCLACTVIVMVSMDLFPLIESARVTAGILTGIGFLGAGTIISHGFKVKGLTTAASIWTVAVLGIVIGLGYQIVAMVATLLVLGILHYKKLDRYFIR